MSVLYSVQLEFSLVDCELPIGLHEVVRRHGVSKIKEPRNLRHSLIYKFCGVLPKIEQFGSIKGLVSTGQLVNQPRG